MGAPSFSSAFLWQAGEFSLVRDEGSECRKRNTVCSAHVVFHNLLYEKREKEPERRARKKETKSTKMENEERRRRAALITQRNSIKQQLTVISCNKQLADGKHTYELHFRRRRWNHCLLQAESGPISLKAHT